MRHPAERGTVLIVVLGLLALVSTLGLGFIAFTRLERTAASHLVDQARAQLFAQAGIAKAVSHLTAQLEQESILDIQDAWNFPPGSGVDLAEARQLSFQVSNSPLSSGTLEPTPDQQAGDRDHFLLKVLDVSGQLDFNLPSQNREGNTLRRMLLSLGAAIAVDHQGQNPLPIATVNRILAARAGLPGGLFTSKAQVRAVMRSESFTLLSDYFSVQGLSREAMFEPTPTPSFPRTYPAQQPDIRVAVNVNTAPFPVLAAVFEGLQGNVLVAEAVGPFLRAGAGGEPTQISRLGFQPTPVVNRTQAHSLARALVNRRASGPIQTRPLLNDLLSQLAIGQGVEPGLLIANADPALLPNGRYPDAALLQSMDRANLNRQTVPFCLAPEGVFEIDALGRITHGEGDQNVVAEARTRQVIRLFVTLTQQTQADFELAKITGDRAISVPEPLKVPDFEPSRVSGAITLAPPEVLEPGESTTPVRVESQRGSSPRGILVDVQLPVRSGEEAQIARDGLFRQPDGSSIAIRTISQGFALIESLPRIRGLATQFAAIIRGNFILRILRLFDGLAARFQGSFLGRLFTFIGRFFQNVLANPFISGVERTLAAQLAPLITPTPPVVPGEPIFIARFDENFDANPGGPATTTKELISLADGGELAPGGVLSVPEVETPHVLEYTEAASVLPFAAGCIELWVKFGVSPSESQGSDEALVYTVVRDPDPPEPRDQRNVSDAGLAWRLERYGDLLVSTRFYWGFPDGSESAFELVLSERVFSLSGPRAGLNGTVAQVGEWHHIVHKWRDGVDQDLFVDGIAAVAGRFDLQSVDEGGGRFGGDRVRPCKLRSNDPRDRFLLGGYIFNNGQTEDIFRTHAFEAGRVNRVSHSIIDDVRVFPVSDPEDFPAGGFRPFSRHDARGQRFTSGTVNERGERLVEPRISGDGGVPFFTGSFSLPTQAEGSSTSGARVRAGTIAWEVSHPPGLSPQRLPVTLRYRFDSDDQDKILPDELQDGHGGGPLRGQGQRLIYTVEFANGASDGTGTVSPLLSTPALRAVRLTIFYPPMMLEEVPLAN